MMTQNYPSNSVHDADFRWHYLPSPSVIDGILDCEVPAFYQILIQDVLGRQQSGIITITAQR